MHVIAGLGYDTVDVLGTSLPTYLSSGGGAHKVNVYSAGVEGSGHALIGFDRQRPPPAELSL